MCAFRLRALLASSNDSIRNGVAVRETKFLWLWLFREQLPQVSDGDPLHRQHAVLQAVEILAMDWRYEVSNDQTVENSRCEVVFSETRAELGILREGL